MHIATRRSDRTLIPLGAQHRILEEVYGSAFNASGADARHERAPTRARSAAVA